MKATQLLRMQHQDIEQLFDRLEGAAVSERDDRRDDLAAVLVAHSAMERQIFYPACALVEGFDDEIREALEEHAIVEWTLQRLLAAQVGDLSFLARVVVLRDIFKHHVDDEEDEILPEAERTFDEARLDDLGARMGQFFQQVRLDWEPHLAEILGVIGSSLRMSKPAAKRVRAVASVKRKRTAPAKRKRTAPAKRKHAAPAKRRPAKKTIRIRVVRASAPTKRKGARKSGRKRVVATVR